MLPVGFEPTISAGERPQTYALERAATGTGTYVIICKTLFVDLTWRNLCLLKFHLDCLSLKVMFYRNFENNWPNGTVSCSPLLTHLPSKNSELISTLRQKGYSASDERLHEFFTSAAMRGPFLEGKVAPATL